MPRCPCIGRIKAPIRTVKGITPFGFPRESMRLSSRLSGTKGRPRRPGAKGEKALDFVLRQTVYSLHGGSRRSERIPKKESRGLHGLLSMSALWHLPSRTSQG